MVGTAWHDSDRCRCATPAVRRACRPLIDGSSWQNQRVEFVVDLGDTTSTVVVAFDNGESHHYNNRSLRTGKIELIGSDKKPKRLTVKDFKAGDRVRHKKHGEGAVEKIGSSAAK